MKNIVGFVRWQWRKFEFWQKCWIFSILFFGAGVVQEDGLIRSILISVPLFVIFLFMLKWIVWDKTIESYKTYRQEKSTLIEIIKTSDRR